MITATSEVVVRRFFFAISILISSKKIRGVKTFTDRYGIDRRNFVYVSKNPTSNQFDPAWLVYICRDFRVSPSWLLLGDGSMFIPAE